MSSWNDSMPVYPKELGTTVAKYRRMASEAGSVAAMDKISRHRYGAAVEQAILAKQRSEFMKVAVEPGARCPCASGTWLSEGADIEAAIRKQQHNALINCPQKIRRARTPEKWQSLYNEAMQEKRAKVLA